jgi:hypothetical protein
MAGKKYSDIFKLSNTANVADTDLLAVERSNGNTYILRANSIYSYITTKISNTSVITFGNTISIGNSLVNTQINSTSIKTQSIVANGSIGNPGDLLTSNGTATYWAAPPSGLFSNGVAYIWSAVQTFNANVVIEETQVLKIGNVTINSTSFNNGSLDGGEFS